jgi:uncharacterized membrane protein
MLAAGGIVILYVATYASLDFYRLIEPATAFALMVAITAAGAWRAHAETAQGLALLAVAGGFMTPFLVGGDSSSPHVLFTYDAILVVGTLWLARRHDWPALHLVSFLLTGFTILAWGDRHYSNARWLSTELWLTVFAVLFALIWRTIPRSFSGSHQAARLVLGMGPLIYHVASLGILWRQTAGLLIYLIAATVFGVIVAGHTRRAWVRLATWALVALPTLDWLSSRPARWDIAPLVALFGIYALHLVAQLRESTDTRSVRLQPDLTAASPPEGGPPREKETPPLKELFMLHVNGLWLWAGLALLFEDVWYARMGTMTFALAGWNGLLAAAVRARNRETALHLLALASAFVAAGVAIELDGPGITAAWAVEGAAIVALGLMTRRVWLQVGGGGLFSAAVVRVFNQLLAPAVTSAAPIFNVRTLTALLVVALLGYLAWRYHQPSAAETMDDTAHGRPPEDKAATSQLVATLIITATVLVLVWASAEVDAVFSRSAWFGQQTIGTGAVTSANLARDVTMSTLWAAYALLLIAIGMRRNYAPLRILAILIFGITVAKVFLVDLSRLDRFYRILSTVALGLLLLVASYLYQRFTRDHPADPAARSA